jgi:hypothetical protein
MRGIAGTEMKQVTEIKCRIEEGKRGNCHAQVINVSQRESAWVGQKVREIYQGKIKEMSCT